MLIQFSATSTKPRQCSPAQFHSHAVVPHPAILRLEPRRDRGDPRFENRIFTAPQKRISNARRYSFALARRNRLDSQA